MHYFSVMPDRVKKPRARTDRWVGHWLRDCRKEAGLEQGDVVSRLRARDYKVDQSQVSRMETGKSTIAADDLPVIVEAFGSTMRRFEREAQRHEAA